MVEEVERRWRSHGVGEEEVEDSRCGGGGGGGGGGGPVISLPELLATLPPNFTPR